MFKVVLDTNILVSSLLASGPPASIVDLIAGGKLALFYSGPILDEYQDVLSRKKFCFTPDQITRLILDITKYGIMVEGKPQDRKTIDKDDQIFYNAAAEAQAYLITGNTRHYPKETFVVTPVRFLAMYQNGE